MDTLELLINGVDYPIYLSCYMKPNKDCAGDPINYTDPTGHWHGKDHLSMTQRVINSVGNMNAKQKKELKRGCTYPDVERELRRRTIYAQGEFHGGADHAEMKVFQLKQAKLWWKFDKARAYLELGIALHGIQDYYAHRVQLKKGAKYIRIRTKELSKKKYWSEDLKNKYKKSSRTNHYLTADNPRAYFVDGDWELVRRKDNKRISSAVKASKKFIINFQKTMKVR